MCVCVHVRVSVCLCVCLLALSYRNREEIQAMRSERDPIQMLKDRMLQSELGTEDEFKVRTIVDGYHKSGISCVCGTLPIWAQGIKNANLSVNIDCGGARDYDVAVRCTLLRTTRALFASLRSDGNFEGLQLNCD